MGIARRVEHDPKLSHRYPAANRFTVRRRETYLATRKEFHDHLTAANVRIKMRNRCAGVISGDRSKPHLPYAFTTHSVEL